MAKLFHGPGAKEVVLEQAQQGRMLAPMFGEDGLKVDEARELVLLLDTIPIGQRVPVIVVGMDRANQFACDALLKTIEEHDEELLFLLWSSDLMTVPGTIRSRCLMEWCPGIGISNEDLQSRAKTLIDASLKKDAFVVVDTINDVENMNAFCDVVLEEFASRMSASHDQETTRIWSSVRSVLSRRDTTRLELIAAFL